MFTKASEKTASLLILVGAPFVCLFIVLASVTDPVNATKLTVAGGLGFALFSIFIAFAGKGNFLNFKYFM
jgi:hypothetical protein